jgi:hypothetical protein
MRPLHELIDATDPALPLIMEWVKMEVRPVEVLPPSAGREDALLATQVTTRSPMGAVVYETGGILVDHGWLRILGSGHERLPRTLPGWNAGRSRGFLLIADDVIGGFFAINGGAFGPDTKNLYYFAPDALAWQPLEIGYTAFVQWAFAGRLDLFYDWIRWPGWDADVPELGGDHCYSFHPPLFTEEGSGGSGLRDQVPVEEAWGLQMHLRKQFDGEGG